MFFLLKQESVKLRPLRAHVLMCLAFLRAHVLTCFACLRVQVEHAMRAYVLTCQRVLLANAATCLACSRTESILKLFFWFVLYWVEKNLWNKVEARKVTRNARGPDLSRTFRHKGSS